MEHARLEAAHLTAPGVRAGAAAAAVLCHGGRRGRAALRLGGASRRRIRAARASGPWRCIRRPEPEPQRLSSFACRRIGRALMLLLEPRPMGAVSNPGPASALPEP